MPVITAAKAANPPNLRGVRSLRSSLAFGVWGKSLLRDATIAQLQVSGRIAVSLLT